MKKSLGFFALLMMLSIGAFAQRNTTSNLSTASTPSNSTAMANKELRDFGLSIIKAYFNHDCNFVYGKLANEITSMESNQKFQKSAQLQQQFCAQSPLRTDMTVSYALYLQNYNPEVLNSQEFAQKYPAYQQVFNLQKDDFFFDGTVLKSGATELFNAADMVRFIVRRIGKNQYEIIAM